MNNRCKKVKKHERKVRNCRRKGKRSRHAKLGEEKRKNRERRRRLFGEAAKREGKSVKFVGRFNAHKRRERKKKRIVN